MLSESRRSLPGRIVLGTLAAGAALSLSACGQLPLLPPALSGDSADESPSPEPTEEESPETEEPTEEPVETEEPPEQVDPEDTDVFTLRVGDCLNEMESNPDETVSEVPKVDCEEPHDFEVYETTDLDGDSTFPGEEEVAGLADEACVDAFEGFVGVEWEESTLEYTTLFPTAEGWEDHNDREALCLVFDPAGQTEGTLDNARF
ncbi:septum formation family protein [Nocardiopsis sp. HNM0947]|uniref:Septum formation family protein n=1 Tax=Nocardiopsis coralli TaxID=2772213 RepID=A0ABR9PEE0_9ACTN|nr:septum formation family protein [Nocardiopsis coralli]MBE3002198.1 septum formation family protein [Nocardiopsis coralli]